MFKFLSLLFLAGPLLANPVISAISSSPSVTTGIVTWTTDTSSSSVLSCGTVTGGPYAKTGVDNTSAQTATSHSAIVAGLTPSTVQFCTVASTDGAGTTTSSQFSFTTSALPASTPIKAALLGPVSRYNDQGNSYYGNSDTFCNCVSSDNKTYITEGDSAQWNNPGAGQSMATGAGSSSTNLSVLTNESPLQGALVNQLSSWGQDSQVWGDGLTSKSSGLLCLAGNLYMSYTRQHPASAGVWPLTQQYGGMVISKDHGATWANWTAPGTASSTGAKPASLTAAEFATSPNNMATLGFVIYGTDGSISPRVDNQDAYVYTFSNDGFWNNGSNQYLQRVPRAKIANLSASDFQYFTGGDGNLDSNWSSTQSAAVAMLTGTNQISLSDIKYIPSLGRYVNFEWYYSAADQGTAGAPTVWAFYEAPHPWGPWTKFYQSSHDEGYYNPVALQRSVLNTASNGSTVKMMATGNFNVQGTPYVGISSTVNQRLTNSYQYAMYYWDLQLLTAVQPRAVMSYGAAPNTIPTNGLVYYADFTDPFNGLSGLKDWSPGGKYSQPSFTLPSTHTWTEFGVHTVVTSTGVSTGFNAALGSFTTIAVFQQSNTGSCDVGAVCNYSKVLHKNPSQGFDIQRNGTTPNNMGCAVNDNSVAPYGIYSNNFTDGQVAMITCRRNLGELNIYGQTTGQVDLIRNDVFPPDASKVEPTTATDTTTMTVAGGGATDYNGWVSAVLVYNRALTDAEIASVYSALQGTSAAYGITLPAPGQSFSNPTNAVEWWPMNETSGQSLAALVNPNAITTTGITWATVTGTGAPAHTIPVFNGSASGTAANQAVTNFGSNAPMSVGCWATFSASGNQEEIIGTLDNLGNYVGWDLLKSTTNTLTFAAINAYPTAWMQVNSAANAVPTSGAFTHVMATYNGVNAAGVTLYINGSPVSTASTDSDNLGSASIANTKTVTIGNRYGSASPHTGKLADCRVYNRALTSTEVSNIYTQGAK